MTQPSLSLQIKSLEKKLNSKLFQRKGNSIELTDTGKIVYSYAIKMLALDRQLQLSVQEVIDGNAGHITVVSSRPFGRYILPKYMLYFSQEFPNIEIKTSLDNSYQVSKIISEDKANIGFMAVSTENEIPEQLERVRIYRDNWVLVCKKNAPWTKFKNSRIENLMKEAPLIGSLPKLAHGLIIHSYLQNIGIDYETKFPLDDIESVKMALLSQLGVAFLPRITVEKELAFGEFEEIPLSNFESNDLDYYLITKKDIYASPALQKFISFIKTSNLFSSAFRNEHIK